MLLLVLHDGTPDRLAGALLPDRRHLLPVRLVCLLWLWVLRRCRCRYQIHIDGRPLGLGLGESRGEHRGMTIEVARVAPLRRECCLLGRWRCKHLLVPEVQQLLALFLLLLLHLLLALLLLELPLQGMVGRGKCPVLLTLGFELSLQGSQLLFCSLNPGRQWKKGREQIMAIHSCNTWKPTILGREVVIIAGPVKRDASCFLKRKLNRKTRIYGLSHPPLARNLRIVAHLSASDRFLSFRVIDSKSMPMAVCLNLAISTIIYSRKQAIKKRQGR